MFLTLKVDFKSCIDAYAIVFSLHGTVGSALIVTQGLVQQISRFGIEGRFELFAESVAGIYIQIVDFIVVAVVEGFLAHFVDEFARKVIT